MYCFMSVNIIFVHCIHSAIYNSHMQDVKCCFTVFKIMIIALLVVSSCVEGDAPIPGRISVTTGANFKFVAALKSFNT